MPEGGGLLSDGPQLSQCACDVFDQKFEAAGGRCCDDFLVNPVAEGGGWGDITRLPVTGQCCDEYRAGGKSFAEFCLKHLVQFSGDENPDGFAKQSDVDREGP